MTNNELHDLIFEAWEAECATAQFYAAAAQCAPTSPLATEWNEWRAAALDRVHAFEELLRECDADRGTDVPARENARDASDEHGRARGTVSSTF